MNASNDAPLVPPKAIKIFLQTKDSDWFVDLLTIEEFGDKILLSKGGSGSYGWFRCQCVSIYLY